MRHSLNPSCVIRHSLPPQSAHHPGPVTGLTSNVGNPLSEAGESAEAQTEGFKPAVELGWGTVPPRPDRGRGITIEVSFKPALIAMKQRFVRVFRKGGRVHSPVPPPPQHQPLFSVSNYT